MVDKFYRLGCDIGGTFTDFVMLNDKTGELKIYKCLTTPKDPIGSLLLVGSRLSVGTRLAGLYEIDPDASPGQPVVIRSWRSQTTHGGDTVNSLTMTSDGHLWYSGPGGAREVTFDAEAPDTPRIWGVREGLAPSTVEAVAEDAAGNIWIGTDGAGVFRLRRGGFRTYTVEDGLAGDEVKDLLVAQDALHVVTANGRGLFLNRFADGRFTAAPRPYYVDPLAWGTNQLILRDRVGDWWYANWTGVVRTAARWMEAVGASPARRYGASEGTWSDQAFKVFEDSRGDVWIGTYDAVLTLQRLDGAALLWRLWQRVTYRVSVRLLLSYLLLGVTPFAICAALGGAVLYMAAGQYTSVRFGDEMDRLMADLDRDAREIATVHATSGLGAATEAFHTAAGRPRHHVPTVLWRASLGGTTLVGPGAEELPDLAWMSSAVTTTGRLGDRLFGLVAAPLGDSRGWVAAIALLDAEAARAISRNLWYDIYFTSVADRDQAGAEVEGEPAGEPAIMISSPRESTITVDSRDVRLKEVWEPWPESSRGVLHRPWVHWFRLNVDVLDLAIMEPALGLRRYRIPVTPVGTEAIRA